MTQHALVCFRAVYRQTAEGETKHNKKNGQRSGFFAQRSGRGA